LEPAVVNNDKEDVDNYLSVSGAVTTTTSTTTEGDWNDTNDDVEGDEGEHGELVKNSPMTISRQISRHANNKKRKAPTERQHDGNMKSQKLKVSLKPNRIHDDRNDLRGDSNNDVKPRRDVLNNTENKPNVIATGEKQKTLDGNPTATTKNKIVKTLSGRITSLSSNLTANDMKTLINNAWLNDEVINTYLTLIVERASLSEKGLNSLRKVYKFNTHFYTQLQRKGYQFVRRWTRYVDISSYDYIIIPINLKDHWYCGIINYDKQCFEYYDSQHQEHPEFFMTMRKYLKDEHEDKELVPFNSDNWVDYYPKNMPFQTNNYDCGVFMCTVAEYRSRDAVFDFDQKDMPKIRERMSNEITEMSLINRPLESYDRYNCLFFVDLF